MEVTTTVREDGKTQVTVAVTADEIKPFVDAHYKELSRARIPGFRPGRAPRKILDQNFGGHAAVMAEIATDMINDLAPKAVDGEDILFIENPEFEKAEPIAEGQDYTFTLFGEVKPAMELLSYDPVEIKMPPEEATDEEIDNQLEALRSYYYDFKTVEGRASQTGDYIELGMKCTAGDEPVQGLNSDNRLVELGAGIVPAAFEAEVTGLSTGDSKVFDFSVEGLAEYDYLETTTIHAEIEVKSIREKVAPELNDDLAKKLGADDVATLRTNIADALNKQKAEQLPPLKERRCTEALAERLYGEVSDTYLKFVRQDILREFYNNLQRSGATLDQFFEQQGISAEEFNEDLAEEAKEVAAQTLALDALFKEKGLEVTEEDIAKEFEVVDNPEETRAEWEKNGRMTEIREAIARRKATEWLLENAIVTISTDEDEDDEEEDEPEEE